MTEQDTRPIGQRIAERIAAAQQSNTDPDLAKAEMKVDPADRLIEILEEKVKSFEKQVEAQGGKLKNGQEFLEICTVDEQRDFKKYPTTGVAESERVLDCLNDSMRRVAEHIVELGFKPVIFAGRSASGNKNSGEDFSLFAYLPTNKS